MNTTDRDHQSKEEQALEMLFKHGSSRPKPPEMAEAAIRKNLHEEWRQQVQQRARRRIAVGWAIAASMVLAVFIVMQNPGDMGNDFDTVKLATSEKVIGFVFVQKPGELQSVRLDSHDISSGDLLSTGSDSGVALRWTNGESLRLDQNSRIQLVSASQVKLLVGKIYVDSGAGVNKNQPFSILTPLANVSHVGTQYITELNADGVSVSVREGAVTVDYNDVISIAETGQALQLDATGRYVKSDIALYGEAWTWAEQVSPAFDMDGRSLKELLEWVAHETGRQIQYGSLESEGIAAKAELHGTIDFEPLKAMDLMLQTSGLTHVLKDGVILITIQSV